MTDKRWKPQWWSLKKVLPKIRDLREMILSSKGGARRRVLTAKREIEQIKKHIVFLYNELDELERWLDTHPQP